MFGFIYNTYEPSRGIFYDGKEENLKYCCDPQAAKTWREENKSRMRTVTAMNFGAREITVNIPFADSKATENDSINDWMENYGINSISRQIIGKLLDSYYSNPDGTFYPRDKKKEEKVNGVLMNMRNIIEGIFRVSPLKIPTGLDPLTKIKTSLDYPLGQNMEAKINRKDVKLQGIYAPAVRKMIFNTIDFDGSTLQPRQQDALYRRGLYSFIIGPREGGKSVLTASHVAEWILKEISLPQIEKMRGIQILYYGQSDDSNKRFYKYVKGFLQKISKNKDFIRASDSEQTIKIFDGEVDREIQFLSQLSKGKGRGERPSLIVIDEAARIDEEIWKISIGTTGTPILAVSTIDYDSRKNWFYDEFLKAEKEQRKYEDIDSLIIDIFFKYNLNGDVQTNIDNGNFAKARDEFYERRTRVALRYTIEDVHPAIITPAQKKIKLESAGAQGEKFLMAEYYGIYVDDVDVLSYDGLVIDTRPTSYDFITMGYDGGGAYDFAAVTVLGVKNLICYPIESKRLSSDPVIQLQELKALRLKYPSMISGDRKYINLGADVSQAPAAVLQGIEDRGTFVDYPIVFTMGKGINYENRFHKIGKVYFVENIIRDEFFRKNNIKIHSSFIGEKEGLADEIDSFKKIPNPSGTYTYRGVKSKDDIVFSLMIALYVAYVEILRDEYIRLEGGGETRYGSIQDLVPKNSEDSYNSIVTYWN